MRDRVFKCAYQIVKAG